jgi:probable F420-dependent oxidoreductase
VQLGFALPTSGSWARRDNMAALARRAEELGYVSLWSFQRLLYPPDSGWAPVYRSVHDPVVPLAYVAGLTSRIRLGTAIVNAPFYPPVLLAKQLATLDEVTQGRLDAGLGLGWSREEYAAAGVAYERRGARMEEFVRCLRSLWTDEIVDIDGEFYRVPRARVDPKPVQRPHPPLLFGGTAEPALRRTGRVADGWISSSRADLSALGASISVVRDAATEAGRAPAALRFVVRGVVAVRPSAGGDAPALTGPIDKIRDDLVRVAEQGATELFVDLNFDPEIGSPDADPAESLRRAHEVLEALAPAGS